MLVPALAEWSFIGMEVCVYWHGFIWGGKYVCISFGEQYTAQGDDCAHVGDVILCVKLHYNLCRYYDIKFLAVENVSKYSNEVNYIYNLYYKSAYIIAVIGLVSGHLV